MKAQHNNRSDNMARSDHAQSGKIGSILNLDYGKTGKQLQPRTICKKNHIPHILKSNHLKNQLKVTD